MPSYTYNINFLIIFIGYDEGADNFSLLRYKCAIIFLESLHAMNPPPPPSRTIGYYRTNCRPNRPQIWGETYL
jgi:hypothetical protein